METIGDSGLNCLDSEYKTPSRTLSVEDIIEKNNHNIMMIDIASSLNHAEFDEVKDCATTFEMWKKLKDIYGGDDNVKRAKVGILRGQFDQMKMREDEKIEKYVERIKASVSAIRSSGGNIEDKIVVSKVLKNLLPIYEIRVSYKKWDVIQIVI